MHNDDNAKQKQNLHGRGNRTANQHINQTKAVPKHRSNGRRTETNEIKVHCVLLFFIYLYIYVYIYIYIYICIIICIDIDMSIESTGS